YGQCGGIGWTGYSVCANPYSCVDLNPYYSEVCLSDSTLWTVCLSLRISACLVSERELLKSCKAKSPDIYIVPHFTV
ncbi:hypothetical protein SISSUDRAFT_987169, partial [Sistotremastrum suecicum HHB10207 ss-3]